MADITPLIPIGRQLIQAYGDGGFRIAGSRWEGSVIVLRDRTVSWPVAAMSAITPDSLATVMQEAAGIEILLVGTGSRTEMLDPAVRDGLKLHGIVAEGMDTGAACRTFNVLLGEDRRVAAALIAV